MRISKKEYDLLTFPWRCLGEMTLRPQPPYHGFVTTCEVWRLRLLYPVAWPAVFGGIGVLIVFVPMLGVAWLLEKVCSPVVMWLAKRFGQIKVCKKVEWSDGPTTQEPQ